METVRLRDAANKRLSGFDLRLIVVANTSTADPLQAFAQREAGGLSIAAPIIVLHSYTPAAAILMSCAPRPGTVRIVFSNLSSTRIARYSGPGLSVGIPITRSTLRRRYQQARLGAFLQMMGGQDAYHRLTFPVQCPESMLRDSPGWLHIFDGLQMRLLWWS